MGVSTPDELSSARARWEQHGHTASSRLQGCSRTGVKQEVFGVPVGCLGAAVGLFGCCSVYEELLENC